MFNKCFILVGFLVAVSIAASVVPRGTTPQLRANVSSANVSYVGNNLYIGQRQSGDSLWRQYPVYRAAVPNRVVTQTLTIFSGYKLTFISAIDQSRNKTLGAFPRLVSGGPGSTNATLYFTSKVGQPINHSVNAFGRR